MQMELLRTRDVRQAVSLVHSLQPEIQIADIEPILIHCARELAERPDLADGEKDHHNSMPDLSRHGK